MNRIFFRRFFSSLSLILSLIYFMFALPSFVFAAKIIDVWEQPKHLSSLKQFYFHLGAENPVQFQQLGLNTQAKLPEQFVLLKKHQNNKTWHARFNQYYQDIPIWGAQLLIHQKQEKHKIQYTGTMVTEIARDLPTIRARLTKPEASDIAQKKLLQQHKGHQLSAPRLTNVRQFIYLENADSNSTSKAQLAYRVSFFIDDLTDKKILNPVFLIDANNGDVLVNYDNFKTAAVGTGRGGTDVTSVLNSDLPRVSNAYQFGESIGGLPSLGTLPINIHPNSTLCSMSTRVAEIRSWHNARFNEHVFPITYRHEKGLPIFTFECLPASNYQNVNDSGEAPIINKGHMGYSPNNDSYYFANEAYNMVRQYLPDIAYPWGVNLPIRIYTHISGYDNAGTLIVDPDDFTFSLLAYPTQMIIGNGGKKYYPLTNSAIIAHETAHIFTAYHSNLVYEGQSGALNEAYSDITGVTFDAYLQRHFPWYGFNWAIGPSMLLPNHFNTGHALRYLDDPTRDGNSIDHISKYTSKMNVHYASGVINKAFYLAVKKYGVYIMNAYKYFSYANVNYWTPRTNFNQASCGVMQAAMDSGSPMDVSRLRQAFSDVGIVCRGALT